MSHYSTKLLTYEEERIHLYMKGLNYNLQVFFVHMTLVEKGFNKVSNDVKKLERVTQVGQAKILAKKSQNICNFSWPNIGNFSWSYFKGHGL